MQLKTKREKQVPVERGPQPCVLFATSCLKFLPVKVGFSVTVAKNSSTKLPPAMKALVYLNRLLLNPQLTTLFFPLAPQPNSGLGRLHKLSV
jgi:hypothetical protein